MQMDGEDIGVRMHWVGSPLRIEGDKTFFGAVENVISKDRYERGQCIYLQPSDPKQDLYIGKIEDLYENRNDNRKIIVRWFYRCCDIQKKPPSGGHGNEVYFTYDFDHQPVESIAGSCQVLPKLEFDSRVIGCDPHIYMYEWVYSNEKDLFTHIDNEEGDKRPASNIRRTAIGVTGGSCSSKVLLDIEEQASKSTSVLKWVDSRQEWITGVKNAITVNELSLSLLQLEDGLSLHDHQNDRNFGLKSKKAWREAVGSVQNYDQLLKYAHSFGVEVKKMSEMQGIGNDSSVIEQDDTTGSNGKDTLDNSSKKRKASSDPKLAGKERIIALENGCDASSKRQSLAVSKNGKGAASALARRNLPIVQDTLALDEATCEKTYRVCESESVVKSDFDDLESMMDLVKVGNAYEINRNEVPDGAPEELLRACTVMVTRKGNKCVTIKYPSTQSLRDFFSHAQPADYSEQGRNLRNQTDYKKRAGDGKRQAQFGKEALIGDKPELDGFYELSIAEAKRLLIRPVSRMELTHQTHLKRFWVAEPDKFDWSVGDISESKEDDIDAESEQCERKLNFTKVTGDLARGFHLGSSLKKEMQAELQKSTKVQVKRKVKRKNSRPRKSDDGTNKVVATEDAEESGGVKECQSNAGGTENKSHIKADVEKAFSDAAEALTKLVDEGNPTNLQGMEDDSLCLGEVKWATKRRATLGVRAALLKTGGSGILSAFETSQGEQLKGPDKGIARVASTSLISPSPQSQSAQWGDTRKETGSTGTKDVSDSDSVDEADEDENPEKSPKTGKMNVKLLKLPKDLRRRWSNDRYKAAQLKLVEIMKGRGAVPGKPILRPALREEARKHIGDTGLLDHLLKHMTDTVVATGERFRRRHNNDGAMEYWLEEADLLEMRQAAGITDASWVPPPGWRPGTNPNGACQGTCGAETKGMTKSEASEFKQLKETVASLQGEIKKLQTAAAMDCRTAPIVSTQDIRETGMAAFKNHIRRVEEQLKKRCQAIQNNMQCLLEKFVETEQQFRVLQSEWEAAENERKGERNASLLHEHEANEKSQDLEEAVWEVKNEVKGLHGKGQEPTEELLLTMSSLRSEVMDRLHKLEMELVGLAKEGVGRDEALVMERTSFENEMSNIYTFVQLLQVEINKLIVELGLSTASNNKIVSPCSLPTPIIGGGRTVPGQHCPEGKKSPTPPQPLVNNSVRPENCISEPCSDKSTNPMGATNGSFPFPQLLANKGVQQTEDRIVQPETFVESTETLSKPPDVSTLQALLSALQRVAHPVNSNGLNVNVPTFHQLMSQQSSCFRVTHPPVGEESWVVPPVQASGPITGVLFPNSFTSMPKESSPAQSLSRGQLPPELDRDQKQFLRQTTKLPQTAKKHTPRRNIAKKLDFQESHFTSTSHEDKLSVPDGGNPGPGDMIKPLVKSPSSLGNFQTSSPGVKTGVGFQRMPSTGGEKEGLKWAYKYGSFSDQSGDFGKSNNVGEAAAQEITPWLALHIAGSGEKVEGLTGSPQRFRYNGSHEN